MHIKLDFQHSLLEVDGGWVVQLRNPDSGHICIPALPVELSTRKTPTDPADADSMGNYPINPPLVLKPIADQQILKIHKRLARCSEFDMANLLNAAGRATD